MNKKYLIRGLCGAGIVLLIVLVALIPSRNLPYSSLSAEPDGTKAAYLLLRELGFDVARRASDKPVDGVLVAFGPAYLRDASGAVTFDGEDYFTNEYLLYYTDEFVQQMMPYKNQTIVFDEYGRTALPQDGSDARPRNLTLGDIMPQWLKILLINAFIILMVGMLFYRQRLGSPEVPEEFSGRQPLEGVHAMAASLQKAQAWRECAISYYEYNIRACPGWDKQGQLRQLTGQVQTEQDALFVMAEIDKRMKEYKR